MAKSVEEVVRTCYPPRVWKLVNSKKKRIRKKYAFLKDLQELFDKWRARDAEERERT